MAQQAASERNIESVITHTGFNLSLKNALASVAICAALVTAPASAYDSGTPDTSNNQNIKSRAPDLSPVKINDQYLKNEIPGDTTPDTLTLKGAVEVASGQNRNVREAKLAVARFKWDYYAAETSRLPNLKILSYLTQQTVPNALVPAQANAFFFASALVPVTHQYRIGLEAKVLKIGRDIAFQKLREELDQTQAKVKTAYYKLALDQSTLADVQDSINYLKELQITVGEQVKRGNSLKAESMEVEARLARAQLAATRATNAYGVDREKLNHLLGRQLTAPVRIEAIPAPSEFELNPRQAEEKALSMRPEILQAEARTKQLNVEKRVIYSEYIPNVSVGVVYITLPGFNNQVIPRNVLAPGIFINWNAFDWGRKAMLAKAKGKQEQASRLTAESVKDDVLIDLHTQINKLTESRQEIAAAQLTRTAASESMRVALNRYKVSATKLADALQAQSSLADANNAYHQALLAFWEANAEFERAVGAD
jgi:outer membrane protein